MTIPGIYKIESKIKPNRSYIGSATNIENRWGSHLCKLRKNEHENKKLQNHFNKYGECDLRFSILLGCDISDLLKVEQYFLDSYKPFFNICTVAGSTIGYKHSDEMKIIFSKQRSGKKLSEEHKNKIRNTLKHRKLTEEHKQRISKSHIGIGHTEATKKILSIKHKGKKLSSEHRERIAVAGIGRIPSAETRIKISKSNSGHIVSDETKRKISETKKLKAKRRIS